ncbi:hypothetical protein P22_3923 [Propionispora sp. 2/2-37]|uniref:type I phosphomannose isomerase catalytic subunit n=1 Tax=Propionispora sp. 2/2-37 TaxID=1677858 RepID=UPI0006BB5AE7|nr:type I phosphomannose isomerase catalytic subunit [Propionispora sp. 2/2-37]CUH97779.1 hypothetical protein P22_3923 [Propionispora sp. 2/2-37]
MYPFKFQPVYKSLVWGGTRLQQLFARELPGAAIGESWEICTRENGMSVVANGGWAGKTLQELLAAHPREILGERNAAAGNFPLLVKFIDANDNLSVQVHPSDEYAFRVEREPGKTEAWYVLAARENAQIVYGLKAGISRERFIQAVASSTVGDMLRTVPVKAGDMIFVPAGLVHALLEGVVVCEVQQNSDTTYRVYDYDRPGTDGKPRELHVNKALDVIDFDLQPEADFSNNRIACEYFSMETCRIAGEQQENTNNHYLIFSFTSGKGNILYQGFSEAVKAGDTILIPACLDTVTLQGDLQYIKIR